MSKLKVNEIEAFSGTSVSIKSDSTFEEDVVFVKDVQVQGNLVLGNAESDSVTFAADVDSNIIPDDDDTWDLGTSTKEWRNIFIDGTATIDTLQVDENATITGDATVSGNATITGNLTVNGTTTTVNSATITIDDPNIQLGAVDSPTDTTANGGGITLMGATSKTIAWSDTTDRWHFNQGIEVDTGNLIVDAGNFGVGTTSPQDKLEVKDGRILLTDADVAHGVTNVAPTDTYGVFGPIHATYGGLMISGVSDQESAGARSLALRGISNDAHTDTVPLVEIIGAKRSGVTVQALDASETVLQVANHTTELVTVLGSGNLGIGTAVPDGKLHVMKASAGSVTASGDGNALVVEDDDVAGVTLLAPNEGVIFFGDASDPDIGRIRYNHSTDSMRFWTNNAERVRIGSSGNVGIGVTTPQSKLDVEGSVAIGAGWAGSIAAPTDGLIVEGNVGIGTSFPQSKLDVNDGRMALTDTDVAHGITNVAATSAYGDFGPIHATRGGLMINGMSDQESADARSLALRGISNDSHTDTVPLVEIIGAKRSGVTVQALGATETVLQVANHTTELVTVLGSGGLGIGTTTPLNKLDVFGGVTIGEGWAGIRAGTADGLVVEGNVGIGTSFPQSKLDINNGHVVLTDTDVAHGVTNVAATNAYGDLGPIHGTRGGLMINGISDQESADARSLALRGISNDSHTDTVPLVEIIGAKRSGSTIQALDAAETVLQVANHTTELMTVLGSGNLGIGTASPEGTLHVMKASAGSVTVTGDQANGIIIEDDDSTAITLLDPSGGVIYFGDADDTDIGRIGYRHGGDYANSLYFTTNNAQRMTIDSAGNLGIGTPTPQSKLDVEGGVAIGATYSGTSAAPANGLLVEGNVGVGTASPGGKLEVKDGSLLLTDSDVAHGVTGIAPTNTYGAFGSVHGTKGGLYIQGLSDQDAADARSLVFRGVCNDSHDDGVPLVEIIGAKRSGSSIQALAAAETVLEVANHTTELMTVLGSGNVGIGTTTPQSKLDVEGSVAIGATYSGTSAAPSNGLIVEGQLGVGVEVPTRKLHVQDGSIGIVTNSADNAAKNIKFEKSRSDTDGAHTVVSTSDKLGAIQWNGSGGSSYIQAASISCIVDGSGTPGGSSMPGKMVFSTTPDGATSSTNRMFISQDGNVGIGSAASNPERMLEIGTSAKVDGIRFTWDAAGSDTGYSTGWGEITVEDSGGSLRISTYDPTASQGNIVIAADGKTQIDLLASTAGAFEIKSGADPYITIDTTQPSVRVEQSLSAYGGFMTSVANITATSTTLDQGHAGKIITVNVAGNSATTLTLPDSQGDGMVLRIVVGTTNDGGITIQAPDANNIIQGSVIILDVDDNSVNAFATAADSDTVTLDSNTGKGGQIGDYIELIAIATDKWAISGQLRTDAGTNPVTPFSAAVS